ncbi:MAG: hypothetical protein ACR2PT_14860 [Endozoicomonas sp.]
MNAKGFLLFVNVLEVMDWYTAHLQCWIVRILCVPGCQNSYSGVGLLRLFAASEQGDSYRQIKILPLLLQKTMRGMGDNALNMVLRFF